MAKSTTCTSFSHYHFAFLVRVCLCASLRQPQRTMAFAGMLSDKDIKAAVQACQGESGKTPKCKKMHKQVFNHKQKRIGLDVSFTKREREVKVSPFLWGISWVMSCSLGTKLLQVTWHTSGRRPVTYRIPKSFRSVFVQGWPNHTSCKSHRVPRDLIIYFEQLCLHGKTYKAQSFAPMKRKCQQWFAL